MNPFESSVVAFQQQPFYNGNNSFFPRTAALVNSRSVYIGLQGGVGRLVEHGNQEKHSPRASDILPRCIMYHVGGDAKRREFNRLEHAKRR